MCYYINVLLSFESMIMFSTHHYMLYVVCAENHVRSWTITRFRGLISTQPGSTPIASFKVLSLEGAHSLFYPVNSIGKHTVCNTCIYIYLKLNHTHSQYNNFFTFSKYMYSNKNVLYQIVTISCIYIFLFILTTVHTCI